MFLHILFIDVIVMKSVNIFKSGNYPAINAIVMDLRSKDPVSSTRQGWRSTGGRRPLATARPQIHMMGSFDWLTPSQRLRGGPAG